MGKYQPKPAREITCKRCGIKFLVKGTGHGKTKYCIECKVDIYSEHNKALYKLRKEGK